MSDSVQTIPTLQAIPTPPSLKKPKVFDVEAEAYLLAQRNVFVQMNQLISVLNPVAAAVMQHSQSVDESLNTIQTLAGQVSNDKNTVAQKANQVATDTQTVLATAAQVESDRQRAESAANSIDTSVLQETINSKLDKTAKAADSDKLDGLEASQLLRSDEKNTGNIEFENVTADGKFYGDLQGNADNANKLAERSLSDSATENTVAGRDAQGDIFARLLRSTHSNDSEIDDTAAIAFRRSTTDNATRFTDNKQSVRDWAGVYSKTQVETAMATKQPKLVAGENIKTINGESVLGSGDLATYTMPIGGRIIVDKRHRAHSEDYIVHQNDVVTTAIVIGQGDIWKYDRVESNSAAYYSDRVLSTLNSRYMVSDPYITSGVLYFNLITALDTGGFTYAEESVDLTSTITGTILDSPTSIYLYASENLVYMSEQGDLIISVDGGSNSNEYILSIKLEPTNCSVKQLIETRERKTNGNPKRRIWGLGNYLSTYTGHGQRTTWYDYPALYKYNTTTGMYELIIEYTATISGYFPQHVTSDGVTTLVFTKASNPEATSQAFVYHSSTSGSFELKGNTTINGYTASGLCPLCLYYDNSVYVQVEFWNSSNATYSTSRFKYIADKSNPISVTYSKVAAAIISVASWQTAGLFQSFQNGRYLMIGAEIYAVDPEIDTSVVLTDSLYSSSTIRGYNNYLKSINGVDGAIFTRFDASTAGLEVMVSHWYSASLGLTRAADLATLTRIK